MLRHVHSPWLASCYPDNLMESRVINKQQHFMHQILKHVRLLIVLYFIVFSFERWTHERITTVLVASTNQETWCREQSREIFVWRSNSQKMKLYKQEMALLTLHSNKPTWITIHCLLLTNVLCPTVPPITGLVPFPSNRSCVSDTMSPVLRYKHSSPWRNRCSWLLCSKWSYTHERETFPLHSP